MRIRGGESGNPASELVALGFKGGSLLKRPASGLVAMGKIEGLGSPQVRVASTTTLVALGEKGADTTLALLHTFLSLWAGEKVSAGLARFLGVRIRGGESGNPASELVALGFKGGSLLKRTASGLVAMVKIEGLGLPRVRVASTTTLVALGETWSRWENEGDSEVSEPHSGA